MGLASSCRTIEKLSTALEWVARNKLNIPHIIHILDDFLIAAESIDTCKTSLQQFLAFFLKCGGAYGTGKKKKLRALLRF